MRPVAILPLPYLLNLLYLLMLFLIDRLKKFYINFVSHVHVPESLSINFSTDHHIKTSNQHKLLLLVHWNFCSDFLSKSFSNNSRDVSNDTLVLKLALYTQTHLLWQRLRLYHEHVFNRHTH